MNIHSRGKLGLIACESGKHFAEKVEKELKRIFEEQEETNGIEIRKTNEIVFKNSEIKTEIKESVRNQDIYIFQDISNRSQGMSTNDNFMALKTAIQAAKMSDAHYITVIVPTYPFARQDKTKAREGISAAMAAWELEALGVNRVITLDVHNDAIAGFFRTTIFENLRASREIKKYIKKHIGTENLVIAAPDAGGAARANHYARNLGTPLALIHKERDYSKLGTIENMKLIGEVKGKKVVLIDDMIDTAGTLVNAAKKLKEEGATEVYFGASLAFLNDPAIERINKAYKEGHITKIIGTNVVYQEEEFKKDTEWYDEVSMTKLFAQVIYRINKGLSVSKLFD